MADATWPSLDVVIPYYGPRDLLEEAVRSVVDQSDPHWTLLVVEDGDTGTASSLAEWIEDLGDDRIRYERNPRRLGVAGNFQRCLDLAIGTHVVFLGCDDRMRPSYVGTVRDALRRHPEVGIVQPGVGIIDALGRPCRPLVDRVKERLRPSGPGEHEVAGEELLTSLLHGAWTYFPSLCWRRDLVAAVGFRQDLPVTLDVALLAETVMRGETLLLVDELLFDYRRHDASASSVATASLDRFDEERRLFTAIANEAGERGWVRARRAGRLRATSRLHSLAALPSVLGSADGTSTLRLLRHAFGR